MSLQQAIKELHTGWDYYKGIAVPWIDIDRIAVHMRSQKTLELAGYPVTFRLCRYVIDPVATVAFITSIDFPIDFSPPSKEWMAAETDKMRLAYMGHLKKLAYATEFDVVDKKMIRERIDHILQQGLFPGNDQVEICACCSGSGKVYKVNKCPDCQGRGYIVLYPISQEDTR